MTYNQEFIDDVLYLFNEDRQPISQIAYIMNCSIEDIDMIICNEISQNITEVL
jgi:hypothetical protein